MPFRKELYMRIIITFLLFFLVFGLGYFLSYLKIKDENIVLNNVIRNQNNLLKRELKEINNLKVDSNDYIIGRVLIRDMYNFFDEIVINLGSEDKISVGDGVINSEGLVGVVYKVLDKSSYVKLLSSDYNVSVKLNDKYGNLSNGNVTLLDKYSEIKEGDLVYTSGYGGLREGIYVGKVKEVLIDKDNLGKEVKLELIDNRYLNYIAVIRGK